MEKCAKLVKAKEENCTSAKVQTCHRWMDRQTDRQINRWMDRQTDGRQTDGQVL